MITTFELFKARELQRHNDIVVAIMNSKEQRGVKTSEIAHDLEQARKIYKVYQVRMEWAKEFFNNNRFVVYFQDLEHFIHTVLCKADHSWRQQNLTGKLAVKRELCFLGFELESDARAYMRRWL